MTLERHGDQIIWILFIAHKDRSINLALSPIHLNLESIHENAKLIIEDRGYEYFPSKWRKAAHAPYLSYSKPAESLEYSEAGQVLLRAIGDYPCTVNQEVTKTEFIVVPDEDSTIDKVLKGKVYYDR